MDQKIKEQSEAVDLLFGFAAQGFESFRDGAQVSDAPDFLDEITKLPKAISGLAAEWVKESIAGAGNPGALDELYLLQRGKLISAGVRPALAATIETQVKALHFAVVAAIEASQAGRVTVG